MNGTLNPRDSKNFTDYLNLLDHFKNSVPLIHGETDLIKS
jgi:hypothetical protein